MTDARIRFAITAHEGKIYVFGGMRDGLAVAACERYVV